MSDFLASALSAAKADLDSRRSSGRAYGISKKGEEQKIKPKKPRWLEDSAAKLRAKTDEATNKGYELSDFDLARSRKAMERKQREYKRMFNKGADMALTGDAADNMLIDFDRKWAEGHRQESSSSASSDDETNNDKDDPMIDVEDEFGRVRRIRKSEAWIHEKPVIENARPVNLIHGPHLQRFNPDADKKDEIWAEEEASREVHYDPTFEVRQRGAGYINLGKGQERVERMDDLHESRTSTVEKRVNHGLVEADAPKPIIVPVESLESSHVEASVHPSRLQNLPSHTRRRQDDDVAVLARDAKRSKAGEAFLDTLF